jgi:trans-AT polyketide synthase, acyltransferase and oxidoreductase domains
MLNRHALKIAPEALGSDAFKADYGVKYAYLAGAMYKGIASKELVVAMGKAGLMAYLGTGGLALDEIDANISFVQSKFVSGESYGANLLSDPARPGHEAALVALYLRRGVRFVEASGFIELSPSLVRYRLTGVRRTPGGKLSIPNRVLAKVSRPEVAEAFMRPAPPAILNQLVDTGLLNSEEAELASFVPMSNEICVEADSGGHTDQGVAYALMPAILALRNTVVREQRYESEIHVGAAGGIGTPEAAAAAFVLGADFIMTGSINQCTVEAGTSDTVKDMLQNMNVQDTAYAPAGDMFELGAKVQVLRKGLFFPTRANRLYELYLRHNSLEEIDLRTAQQIQEKYFKRTFAAVWDETCAYYSKESSARFEPASVTPKQKMALIFRWYFVHSTRLALQGDALRKVDYQVQCGPALGSFNQWVKGTELEDWHKRRVADIGARIVIAAAQILEDRLTQFISN